MNDERVIEEIVIKFLLNTCRLRPQLGQSIVFCMMLVSSHPIDDDVSL